MRTLAVSWTFSLMTAAWTMMILRLEWHVRSAGASREVAYDKGLPRAGGPCPVYHHALNARATLLAKAQRDSGTTFRRLFVSAVHFLCRLSHRRDRSIETTRRWSGKFSPAM